VEIVDIFETGIMINVVLITISVSVVIYLKKFKKIAK